MPEPILVKSEQESQEIKKLLDKDLPSYRQAYSDRTAWQMACLSELAYIKEPEFLKSELKHLRLELDETFDCKDTQAFLARGEKFIVLAFRGTEKTSFNDIKTDLKANLKECESGGKIHSGFHEAFDYVKEDIENILGDEKYEHMPLFITGHSLGGALATIATKKLLHKGGIAACYTFGAPRVGNGQWMKGMKTPIYRVVNAVDCVTMIPSSIISGIIWVIGKLSPWSRSIAGLVPNIKGYYHGGDMRYLTNCRAGKYDDVKLLYAVDYLRRIQGWMYERRSPKKFLADHSISIYRRKLYIIAYRRN